VGVFPRKPLFFMINGNGPALACENRWGGLPPCLRVGLSSESTVIGPTHLMR
jgi:hypothetical protein